VKVSLPGWKPVSALFTGVCVEPDGDWESDILFLDDKEL
jgi:hypothetical protein